MLRGRSTLGSTVYKSIRERPARRPPSGWLVLPAVVSFLAVTAGSATVVYAAHLENDDAFCASCHTEPETRFFTQSLAPPVDLASDHAAKKVDCIQCHSGKGAIGRVTAMATVALPDLLAYRSGHFRTPATTTVAMGDGHCLKCHADVTRRNDFNNHFHAFLPLWQARDPRHAATCGSCHISHAPGGNAQLGYLIESTTAAVCERCHGFAGRG